MRCRNCKLGNTLTKRYILIASSEEWPCALIFLPLFVLAGNVMQLELHMTVAFYLVSLPPLFFKLNSRDICSVCGNESRPDLKPVNSVKNQLKL